MKVPFRLPRSRSTIPAGVRRISACRRETCGSSMSRLALASLPITTGAFSITTGPAVPGPASTMTQAEPSGVKDESSSASVSPRGPIPFIP